MGLLFSRKLNNRDRKVTDQREYKRQWWQKHSTEMRQHQSTEKHTPRKSVAHTLDDFREACARQDWESAPMSIWHRIRDEHPSEMVRWLEKHPNFKPPYGVYIGEPGTEPWRPNIDCRNCGERHRYGYWCQP